MKKRKDFLRNSAKVNTILFVFLLIVGLLILDFVDINEKLGFPISVLDEPLMILFGVILGYLIAKFRFIRIIKKEFS